MRHRKVPGNCNKTILDLVGKLLKGASLHTKQTKANNNNNKKKNPKNQMTTNKTKQNKKTQKYPTNKQAPLLMSQPRYCLKLYSRRNIWKGPG